MTLFPDYKAYLPIVKAASAAYLGTPDLAKPAFEDLGMEFIAIVGNGDCYVTVAKYQGTMLWAIRGTQFSENFNLNQVLNNEEMAAYTVSGIPGAAMSGYAGPLQRLLDGELAQYIPSDHLIICGHSMGGIRSLIAAGLLPKSLSLSVLALAPPKGMTPDFARYAYQDRMPPLVVGRKDDFALNHPILDQTYVQAFPILHIGSGDPVWVTRWPFLDESISDHSDTAYVADWVTLAQ